MEDVDNSDIIKTVLTNMLNISQRKSSDVNSFTMMDNILKNLSQQYDFLRFVHVNNTRFKEEKDAVQVSDNVNNVDANMLGRAIQDIVTTMTESLGSSAGFYFIKELQRRLGEDYNTLLEDIGVDLSIMQLEFEVINRMKK
ncbi:MAG: hypothetical protein QXS02_00880 [Candidatus Thermoplasmatota archaeon]